MNVVFLAKGLCTYVPGAYQLLSPKRTGGAVSARYCYSVWLRHLCCAHESGLQAPPEVVAELGPGDSIGTGLAALLSGARQYVGLDVFRYATNERNLRLLDELVELFQARADIPGEDEFPAVRPLLESYQFPAHIVTDGVLRDSLNLARIEEIRRAVRTLGHAGSDIIAYHAPYYHADVIRRESVDMVVSQAVMEHVDDLEGAYHALNGWLKPGGYMQHVIDFSAHWLDGGWNKHWTYSDLAWKLARGKRPYLINRQPHSTHVGLIEDFGFTIVRDSAFIKDSAIGRTSLAGRFRDLSKEDLTTFGAFIQAVKTSAVAKSERSPAPAAGGAV